ncbi:hypothetical protein TL16_g10056 [Triparma laevis f. inornata]|uniref:EF-hand domain-containing protein n=2 Tax=Triparma laevis TaxID=1534972 RepID=A0A9W7ATI0_9STRA|nr:hypothetical protein TrLO_g562 [Triparma laevis f. longispina]GMH84884.1 hypothetical protein TL16_g10056 [Triparma laevis f. inornata]
MHSTKPARVPRNTMELFNMLDLDRNGVLDKTEFYSATAKLNMSEEDTEKLFTKLDINGDGVLTAKEFSDIELQGSLFSVAGLAHFFKQNVMDRATQLEMANPGRWTLSTDKFEKESRKVKQYYD